ncbi:MAG: hypothetical protein M1821_001711 [Bathelium mastoideum]|nr:MAG: hypothetical protein M1821_001711 [Bathelium mastoideum]KAI9691604.1 MAG: hypothetical protein M1822_007675 [Bathelium mastoideum]
MAKFSTLNTVKLVRGDVTKPEDAKKAITAATRPLTGIIQMSMVLYGQNFSKMTFDEWTAARQPNVSGISLSGLVGQPGQANYTNGDIFLDAFTQYPDQLGLEASVVIIRAVKDVGFISENQRLMSKMKTNGIKGVTEKELLDAMAVAMLAHAKAPKDNDSGLSRFANPNTFVLSLGSTFLVTSLADRAVLKKDRRMAAFHNVSDSADATSKDTQNNRSELQSESISSEEDQNTSCTLGDLDLDSLITLESWAWWKYVFGFGTAMLVLMGMGSLDALGQHVAQELPQVLTEDSEVNVP